jgi:hypothetical protein
MNSENDTGFVKSGFINKKGTPSGESAKFNIMPPGEMIEQPDAQISEMGMKKVTPLGYPGSGFKE